MARPVSTASDQHQQIQKAVEALPEGSAVPAIVAGVPVQRLIAEFDAADIAAAAHQKRYKSGGRTALWATTGGTLLGAILLLPIDALVKGLPRSALGFLQTSAIIVTMLALRWLSKRKPIEQWMLSRADAEAKRAGIFRAIVEAPVPPGCDPALFVRHKHAVFTKAFVNYQLAFYRSRAAKHARAAGHKAPYRLLGNLFSVVAILLGVLAALQLAVSFGIPLPQRLSGLTEWLAASDASRWQLGLGTIAASLLAHGSAMTMMDQDERNAALYASSAEKIDAVLSEYGLAALPPSRVFDQQALDRLFDRVQGIMQQEHVAWLVAKRPDAGANVISPKVSRAL